MNAEWLGRLFVCLWVVLPLSAHAWELDSPWPDPLQTNPKELDTGVTLPGDNQPGNCPAFKDFSNPLTLAEAVDLALCNNTQVRAAWSDIKAQAAAAGVARAAYLPVVSGSISRRNDSTRYPGSRIPTQKISSTPLNGVLSWRLFDFGGRGANHDAAMHSLAAALATHNAVLQKTLATVVQSYFDAQVAQSAWQAKTLSEEIAGNTLAAAKRREAKGAGTSGDTLQATTALARAALEKNRAQGNYRRAISILLYGIGLSSQTQVMLADDLHEPLGQAAQDLEQWLKEAQKQHPAIVAAREQLEAARYKAAATRSEGLPALDFTAGYYENGRLDQTATETRSRETVVGVTLNIPLFDGFAHTYKVRASEAQVERQAATLQDTEQQVLMEMVKAHADAVSALGNLDASARLLAAAQEALQAAQRRYTNGAADILEILNTQSAFFDAQQERIRSLAEWRSAKLRMLASAGTMNRADLNPR
ncbi:MAG: TolC family protein [Desulfobulbus sp.]|nr:TolC family protein [Desulfobulbus sp.]